MTRFLDEFLSKIRNANKTHSFWLIFTSKYAFIAIGVKHENLQILVLILLKLIELFNRVFRVSYVRVHPKGYTVDIVTGHWKMSILWTLLYPSRFYIVYLYTYPVHYKTRRASSQNIIWIFYKTCFVPCFHHFRPYSCTYIITSNVGACIVYAWI